MPLFPWCVLSTWNNLHCFPKLFSLFFFPWRLKSGPASHGCSCDFACFLIWNWNCDCKVRGNLLSSRYFQQGRVGVMSVTDMQMTFLNVWSIWRQLRNKVWIDWCRTHSLHELVNSRHFYSARTVICTAHRGDQQVALSLEMKTFCDGRSFALWTSSALFTQPVCMSCFLP